MSSAGTRQPRTMADKILDQHLMVEVDGECLFYIDRLLVHEGSSHAFAGLEKMGRKMHSPRQVIAGTDHYLPTTGRAAGVDAIPDPAIRGMVKGLMANAEKHGIIFFGPYDTNQGIVHVVTPEQGIIQPGMLIAGADSHTTTHGAFGGIAFGVGASDAKHVMATQSLWFRRPKTMRVTLHGALGAHVSAKDVILSLIAQIGAGGAIHHVIEFSGPAVEATSMEARMTLCNMAVEAGGRAGVIAPDATTFAYLDGRPHAPKGEDWDAAMGYWSSLPSDPGAVFDREVVLDVDAVTPTVTWGISPEHARGIDGVVPDPAVIADPEKRREVETALDYMGLVPGMALTDIRIDRVFIGSCTNARIEDLRAAADIARRGQAVVPAWVVPGSNSVKRQAESEGLDVIFKTAGFEWREPGCSLCTALNGDVLAERERCAATSNRNFRGRQGINGRTHLTSPAMAAAAAITGYLTDLRTLPGA
jgi:3-isopropylmalate/(R)-2-methylmalate dehydratase large subunit